MEKMIAQKSVVTIAIVIGMLFSIGNAAADVAVWFEPAAATVDIGSTTSIDIKASSDQPVMGWGIDLLIEEPAYAAWTATLVDSAWDAPPNGTYDGDGLGGLRFPTGLSGEMLLATLTFEGLMLGTTTLTLSGGLDEDEGILLESGDLATAVSFTPATLTVVPEPACALLLSVGALLLIRRR